MSDFETEDQQVEAFKKWWKDNGKTVVIGAVLGFSTIFGGRMYFSYLDAQRMMASMAFEHMNQAIEQQQPEIALTSAEQIVLEFPDTPYAALASLALAKVHVEKNELVAAQNRLQWVVDHEDQPDIVHVARLRLARVLFAADKVEQAQSLLADVDMESYVSMYQELRGDIYLAGQQLPQARLAYAAALEALNKNDDSELLQMKIDDLGV